MNSRAAAKSKIASKMSLQSKLLMAGLGLLVLLLSLFLCLPFFLERFLLTQMGKLGIQEPRITVQTVYPGQIRLGGLGGSNLGLEIESITLDFSLQSLLQAKAELIVISGLQWKLAWQDGQLDPRLPLSQGFKEQEQSTLPLPPVERLQLRSSYLILESWGFSWPLPLAGELLLQEAQDLQAFLETSLMGLPIYISGMGNLDQGRFSLEGNLGLPWSGSSQYPESFLHLDHKGQALVQGGLNFSWEQILDGAGRGGFELHLKTRDQSLQWPGLELAHGFLGLQGTIDQDLYLHKLDADLKLNSLQFQEYLLSSLDLQLRKAGGQLDLHCRLKEPAELELALHGDLVDVNALLDKGFDWSGHWDFELQGILPDKLLSAMAGTADLGLTDLPLQASGILQSRISLEGGTWDYQAEIQARNTRLGPADFALSEPKLLMKDVLFQGPVQAQAKKSEIMVSAAANSSLGFSSGTLIQGEEHFSVQALQLAAKGNEPWAQYRLGQEMAQEIILDARLQKKFALDSKSLQANIPKARISGALGRSASQGWQGVLRMGLEQGLLALHAEGLLLESIILDLPLVLGQAKSEPGRFSLGRIHYKETGWTGPKGTILAQENKMQLQGDWQFLPELKLDFDLQLAFKEYGLQGELQAWSGWFGLSQLKELASLIPELQDLNLTGQARLDLQASLQGKELKPFLGLELQDAGLQNQEFDLRLAGLSGQLALENISPLQTAQDRDIYIMFSELQWGMLGLEQGKLFFRLQGDHFILDSSSFGLRPEGEISIYQGRWDLREQAGYARIYLQEVDPLQILGDLTQGKIVGNGLFSGSFALGIGQDGLDLQGGHLYALPGTGRLGIKDEEWLETLLYYVRESMAGHEYLSLLSQRLEQALQDFEYDFFSLRLLPQKKDVSARIELRGQGIKGDPPQQVGSLVLNINDVQQALNQVLRFNLSREEAVQQALEDVFAPGP